MAIVLPPSQQAAKIRAEIAKLVKVQELARRGILRVSELSEAISASQDEIEAILETDSIPHRILDRWRSTQPMSWDRSSRYVEAADSRRLEDWLGVLTSVVKELDPAVGSAADANADLIREIEAQRNLMTSVATGGPRINSVDGEYQERRERIRVGLARLGLADPSPYSDLWAWYGKWSNDLRGYQSRRDYLRELFEPILRDLRSGIVTRSSIAEPAAQPAAVRRQIVPREEYDVFLSHASEDKEAIARPLYEALVAAGVTVWFDEAVLELGDSLRRKIDEGLARCRYGVVILSPRFLEKQWPQRELDGLVARETSSGEKAILPIWHELDGQTVLRYSPPLADRLAGRSEDGIPNLMNAILRVLAR